MTYTAQQIVKNFGENILADLLEYDDNYIFETSDYEGFEIVEEIVRIDDNSFEYHFCVSEYDESFDDEEEAEDWLDELIEEWEQEQRDLESYYWSTRL